MHTDFLAKIEGFLAESGMSETAFGKSSVSDPNLVSDIRKGRSPSLRLVGRIEQFMDEHRPQSEVRR